MRFRRQSSGSGGPVTDYVLTSSLHRRRPPTCVHKVNYTDTIVVFDVKKEKKKTVFRSISRTLIRGSRVPILYKKDIRAIIQA